MRPVAVGFLLDAAQDYERMALRRFDCTETAVGLRSPYALALEARGVADLAIVARVRRVEALEALLRWGLGSTVIQTRRRHGKTAALRDLATREGLELRAEIESLRAERDALREGAKRVADLLEANGCNCDCECDSDGHDDDCDPCLACRVDAAVRRVHMWTHIDGDDDLPVCSRCGVVRRAGGETVCRGRTPTIATREGLEVSAGGSLEVSAGGSAAEASEAPADTSSKAPAKEGLRSAGEVPS